MKTLPAKYVIGSFLRLIASADTILSLRIAPDLTTLPQRAKAGAGLRLWNSRQILNPSL
jgi:hypothetical protein